ncbi:hypothetical protein SAMN05444365_11515 [Micromonospora pattaloongensis]|uniref:Uncharacterized protein n=1 Tax=Micromonospora pattaloongensis TaxID=405436 RepID=A0A1H3SXA0_9ACTN|nr:hypothetical protein [Micromonospora pattaloongensis]SDZ42400.1 hypothetical protein SAMN05444365_11515 [Micromonospora pattaloongensis]
MIITDAFAITGRPRDQLAVELAELHARAQRAGTELDDIRARLAELERQIRRHTGR